MVKKIELSQIDIPVRRIEQDRTIEKIEPLEYEKLFELVKEPSFFEKVFFLVKNAPKLITVIYGLYKIVKLIQGKEMDNNKRTTILKTIQTVLVAIGGILGWKFLGSESVEILIGAVAAVWLAIDWFIGYFTNKPDEKTTPKVDK